jgi:hypothetical protein
LLARPQSGRYDSKAPDDSCGFAQKLNDTNGFDMSRPSVHHSLVRSLARTTVFLVAASLLAWHGVLLATPHNHADNSVPQEELACAASHPSSQTSHLHDSGRLLSPHPCLACLAGTTVAEAPASRGVESTTDGEWVADSTSPDLRSRFHTQLPLLRGPPPSA